MSELLVFGVIPVVGDASNGVLDVKSVVPVKVNVQGLLGVSSLYGAAQILVEIPAYEGVMGGCMR